MNLFYDSDDVHEKECPTCGEPMVARTNNRDDSQFWGCKAYPECKHTESIPNKDEIYDEGWDRQDNF